MTEGNSLVEDMAIERCPFCRGDGACAELEDDGYARVLCVCTALGPLRKGEAEAIAAWNASVLKDRLSEDDDVRDAIVKAYIAGATDVHVYWRAGGSDTELDFAEAAYDYAAERIIANSIREIT